MEKYQPFMHKVTTPDLYNLLAIKYVEFAQRRCPSIDLFITLPPLVFFDKASFKWARGYTNSILTERYSFDPRKELITYLFKVIYNAVVFPFNQTLWRLHVFSKYNVCVKFIGTTVGGSYETYSIYLIFQKSMYL